MLILEAESCGVPHEAHLDAYLAELRLHRYSISSKRHASRVLGLFFTHLREKGVEDLRAVGQAELVSFARELRESTLSLWTQSTYLSTLRRFFAFLERRNVLLENPAKGLPLPRAQRLPRAVLSQGQVARLMEAPPPSSALGLRDRAILEVLYGTAVRLRECTRLEVFDVDLSERTLW
ncbi:MAG: site-specific integrase, partial [Thermoleophilia bacterium]|nr:site-specific integrase [Thermoleophilia bacterium]